MKPRDPMFLDIETLPLASALAAPYPDADRLPPSNYKNEDAIARWREKDRADWAAGRIKDCSINPRLGRVLCIGMSHDFIVMAKTEAEEPSILRVFWNEVEASRGEVVTWNGAWDLRFLVIRSMVHGIAPTISAQVVRSWFQRYRTAPHFDCRAVLTNWDMRVEGEGLDEWAAFFGITGKLPGMNGGMVYPLAQQGEYERIEQYCGQDVATTKAIYQKVAPMFDSQEAA